MAVLNIVMDFGGHFNCSHPIEGAKYARLEFSVINGDFDMNGICINIFVLGKSVSSNSAFFRGFQNCYNNFLLPKL